MIATITVQQQKSKMASSAGSHFSRDANLAGAPLPVIPRRMTRSQSIPAHFAPQQRIPTVGQHTPDSDSNSYSSNGSDSGSRATDKVRRRRIRGVRTGASSPPQTESSLPSSLKKSDGTSAHLRLAQQKEGPHTTQLRDRATTIVAPRPLMYAPGMLRLSLETMRSHMLSDSHPHDTRYAVTSGSKSAPPPESKGLEVPRLIRKKSGQPVKPSLKTSRSSPGNLSVVTIASSSKSEPTTPTQKAVHFDTKLEHVKLFLAEQKPLAVSRDGSPTEDTSGTDSDFPSFIYGDDDDVKRSKKKLVMRPLNTPSRPDRILHVKLDQYYLNFDGTSILGKVRVQNIAFEKKVAIRFTFDSWQTTSEVTARYAETINPEFDCFSFSIRLNDLLARIEGKTFIMAIRYNVAGQEYWDNNNEQNYVATFTKARIIRDLTKSDDEDASDVDNLRNRLEQVVLGGTTEDANLSTHLHKKSSVVSSKETDPPCFKSSVSLASRYDFEKSLRDTNTWKPSNGLLFQNSTSQSPPRVQIDHSSTFSSLPSSIPWPEKTSSIKRPSALALPLRPRQALASPRDLDDSEKLLFVPPIHSNVVESSSIFMRNHVRSHSDVGSSIEIGSFVKRTPPGSPASELLPLDTTPIPITPSFGTPCRHHSFPPLSPGENSFSSSSSVTFGLEFIGGLDPNSDILSPSSLGPGLIRNRTGLLESSGDSESTSSLTTPTSSASPSPTEPFINASLPPVEGDGCRDDLDSGLNSDFVGQVSPATDYRQFLNKFCFFTGSSGVQDSRRVMIPMQDARPQVTTAVQRREFLIGMADLKTTIGDDLMDDSSTVCSDSKATTPTLNSSKPESNVDTLAPAPSF